MNPYLTFVEGIQSGIDAARNLAVSGTTEPIESDSKALLFSPHPDDECIIGLLPLRMTRETKMQVINVPVTYGSNVERQAGRAQESAGQAELSAWLAVYSIAADEWQEIVLPEAESLGPVRSILVAITYSPGVLSKINRGSREISFLG